MKNKDNVLYDFNDMIKNSWTYEKMTEDEQNNWFEKVVNNVRTEKCLKGTYIQRWEILQAMYNAYLVGIGYTDFNWRCNDEDKTFF